jgi:tetratricopeptide (TPR) repeat protein
MNEPHFDAPHELELALQLDDLPGPARPLSTATARALVQSALSGEAGVVVPLRPVARRVTWSRVAMAAAVLLGFGASASAAVYWARKASQEPAPATRSPTAPPSRAQPAAAPTPPSAPAHEPLIEPMAPKTSRPARHIELPKPAAERAARDQLAEANALRTRGAYAEAAERYAEAAATAPDSLTAHTAHVARGDLALTILKRPADAVGAYRAALRAHAHGPLAPEAWYGLSRAYRAAGDAPNEREALEALCKLAPGTSAGRAGCTRLEALESPP